MPQRGRFLLYRSSCSHPVGFGSACLSPRELSLFRIRERSIDTSLTGLMLGLFMLPASHVCSSTMEAKTYRIGVLMSQDSPPYQQALVGFRQYLEQQRVDISLNIYPLSGTASQAKEVIEASRKEGASLLLTLGSFATREVVGKIVEVPIVAGLILGREDLRQAENATGVILEFPLEIEFQWLQRLLPGHKTIGVLFSPEENRQKIDAAMHVAQNAGLTLIARPVKTPKDLPDALNSLSNRVDALWGVADKAVLSPQMAKTLLLFSLRNRIPFIGVSESWVKAGALYALDRDYTDVGMQYSEMALKILRAGMRASAIPPATPRKVMYSLNLNTARQLLLTIPAGVIHGAHRVFE
jgi:putative ABC transport system substrate-binding protein